jgi:hypothetical protein
MAPTERPEIETEILHVDLSGHMPDFTGEEKTASGPYGFGRVAVLNSGAQWFGPSEAEHPACSRCRFTWALKNNTLYLSSDSGAVEAGNISEDMITRIVSIIGMAERYKVFRIKPRVTI